MMKHWGSVYEEENCFTSLTLGFNNSPKVRFCKKKYLFGGECYGINAHNLPKSCVDILPRRCVKRWGLWAGYRLWLWLVTSFVIINDIGTL